MEGVESELVELESSPPLARPLFFPARPQAHFTKFGLSIGVTLALVVGRSDEPVVVPLFERLVGASRPLSDLFPSSFPLLIGLSPRSQHPDPPAQPCAYTFMSYFSFAVLDGISFSTAGTRR